MRLRSCRCLHCHWLRAGVRGRFSGSCSSRPSWLVSAVCSWRVSTEPSHPTPHPLPWALGAPRGPGRRCRNRCRGLSPGLNELELRPTGNRELSFRRCPPAMVSSRRQRELWARRMGAGEGDTVPSTSLPSGSSVSRGPPRLSVLPAPSAPRRGHPCGAPSRRGRISLFTLSASQLPFLVRGRARAPAHGTGP